MQLIISKKDAIRKWLLIGFIFTIPNSIALNNIILALIFIYWIVFCDKKKTITIVKNNFIAFLAILFFLTFIVSLTYTEDFNNGIIVIYKEIKFLFIPILMQLIKKEEIEIYLKTFIISMMLSEILSYSVFFKIIPPIFGANPYDPTIFMTHIHYNPFLAFTIFILIWNIFKNKPQGISFFLSILFVVTMTINMFITGGRAGWVSFLIILIVGSFLLIKNKKHILLSISIIFFTFVLAYKFSPIVKKRVNLAIYNISHYSNNKNSNVGQRITFWLNTIEMIKKYPILGIGCGDFKKEYKIINNKNTPSIISTSQPHNMYLFIWAINGLFGIIVLLILFMYMFICAFNIKDKYNELRIVFTLLFIIINFSDSYLLAHYTTSLFIFFTALFFKDCKWKKYQ